MNPPRHIAAVSVAVLAAHGLIFLLVSGGSPSAVRESDQPPARLASGLPPDHPLAIGEPEVLEMPRRDPDSGGDAIEGGGGSLFPDGALEEARSTIERKRGGRAAEAAGVSPNEARTPGAGREGGYDVTDLANATEETYEPKLPSAFDDIPAVVPSDAALATALKRIDGEKTEPDERKAAPDGRSVRAFRPLVSGGG